MQRWGSSVASVARACVAPALAAVAALGLGCATAGGGDDPAGADGSVKADGSKDGTSGCPTGRAGPGCTACAGGFHACGNDCVQDGSNVPEKGCAQGCGTACPSPSHATAKCAGDGKCDFVCDPSFEKGDAGCDCATGQIACQTGCAQCCQDTDCAPHVLCGGGSCGGCETGWGDCNGNPADGCETHLNSSGNCGACGNSCCSSLCGCGFLGLGGESCNPSGQTWKCGC